MCISLVNGVLSCINIGDSRCVAGFVAPDDQVIPIPLSRDQTPSRPVLFSFCFLTHRTRKSASSAAARRFRRCDSAATRTTSWSKAAKWTLRSPIRRAFTSRTNPSLALHSHGPSETTWRVGSGGAFHRRNGGSDRRVGNRIEESRFGAESRDSGE